MHNVFFRKVSLFGVGSSAAAALAVFFLKSWIWSMGILTGSLWFFLNSFCLYQLLEIGLGDKSKHKESVLIFSILKFPVLYLIGFFILKSRFFPVESLLSGLTLYLLSFGIVWMRHALAAKTHQDSPEESFSPEKVDLRAPASAGLSGRDQTL